MPPFALAHSPFWQNISHLFSNKTSGVPQLEVRSCKIPLVSFHQQNVSTCLIGCVSGCNVAAQGLGCCFIIGLNKDLNRNYQEERALEGVVETKLVESQRSGKWYLRKNKPIILPQVPSLCARQQVQTSECLNALKQNEISSDYTNVGRWQGFFAKVLNTLGQRTKNTFCFFFLPSNHRASEIRQADI